MQNNLLKSLFALVVLCCIVGLTVCVRRGRGPNKYGWEGKVSRYVPPLFPISEEEEDWLNDTTWKLEDSGLEGFVFGIGDSQRTDLRDSKKMEFARKFAGYFTNLKLQCGLSAEKPVGSAKISLYIKRYKPILEDCKVLRMAILDCAVELELLGLSVAEMLADLNIIENQCDMALGSASYR